MRTIEESLEELRKKKIRVDIDSSYGKDETYKVYARGQITMYQNVSFTEFFKNEKDVAKALHMVCEELKK